MDGLAGDDAEEDLHHVQPRAARRREMQCDPGVLGQPPSDVVVFVGGVVVADDVATRRWTTLRRPAFCLTCFALPPWNLQTVEPTIAAFLQCSPFFLYASQRRSGAGDFDPPIGLP